VGGTLTHRISAVLLTLNEERNIATALRSVASWVDEIVLVDMHSDDRTVTIAEQFGAKIFYHPRIGFQDPARPFAMDKASGEWIINLDADEIVSFELSRQLINIAHKDLADVCSIPRINYIGGKPMLHTGWDPNGDRQLRFFKKDALLFSPRVHVRPTPAPAKRLLNLTYPEHGALIHFNYLNAAHFLDKLNRYTNIEAEQAQERGKRSSLRSFVTAPGVEFLKRYVLLSGFRDGWNGLYYSFLMVIYKMTVLAKMRELEEGLTVEGIRDRYQAIAEEELRRFKA
jgi:glycosyltransferase involved in cell wall biosynthesis